ncbi:MAG TPA: hypothetical protein PLQ76_00050, partial [bacterium]|nr:hypothetical protein [bacterium]
MNHDGKLFSLSIPRPQYGNIGKCFPSCDINIKRTAKKLSAAAAACIFITILSGCGGGGGGGGTPSTPVTPTTGSAPVQSAWSPAANSVLNSGALTLTFQTNENASCRWSASDAGYSSMSNSCSGDSSRAHSCAVTGLPQGAATAYLACSGANAADTASSNTHIAYTIDSSPPSIRITYPANGAGFIGSYPDRVAIEYSDSISGANPAAIEASFTMLGRTVDISDLFAKDAAANASASLTDPSNRNPLGRTTLSVFPTPYSFDTPERSWTANRCGTATLLASYDGSTHIYYWDTECGDVYIADTAGGDTKKVTLSGKAASVMGAPETGKFYIAVKDDPHLYSYSISSGVQTGSTQLPDSPVALSYNQAAGLMFIAYKTRPEIGRFNCSSGSLEQGLAALSAPVFIHAFPAVSGDVAAVSWYSQYLLVKYGAAGNVLFQTDLGQSAPKG